MSGWPWMQGNAVPLNTDKPLPPVDDKDDRPLVKDLIEKYRTKIDQVKNEIKTDACYEENKHDDLWILRFVLSHKKVKNAVKAAHNTIQLRFKHKLDEKDIRGFSPKDTENVPVPAMKRFIEYGVKDNANINFVIPDPRRGVIAFLDLGSIDHHSLIKNVNEDDWLLTHLYISEYTHQWVDYVTRTTGRLTKTIRIADCSNVTLKGINKEKIKRDGHVMSIMEDCYPQMLQTIFICNSPIWVQYPWRILRLLLPKRIIEKIDFLNPGHNKKEHDRLLQYITDEHLPERYGGNNKVWPVHFDPPLLLVDNQLPN